MNRPRHFRAPLSVLPGLAVLAAMPGAAEPVTGTCRFDIECVEAEPCAEAAFTLRVDGGALSSGARAEEVQTFALKDGATVSLGQSATAIEVLTIAPDGAARYTRHLTDGPHAVTRLGRCAAE